MNNAELLKHAEDSLEYALKPPGTATGTGVTNAALKAIASSLLVLARLSQPTWKPAE